MFERFTKPAREVVERAQREARQLHSRHIGTEHLLLALASEGAVGGLLRRAGLDEARVRAEVERLTREPADLPGGPLGAEDAAALRTIGIDLDAVLERIEETVGPEVLQPPPVQSRRGPFGRHAGAGSRFDPSAKKAIELALREAIRLRHRVIGAEHLLLGLLRGDDGRAVGIIKRAGIDVAALRRTTETSLEQAA